MSKEIFAELMIPGKAPAEVWPLLSESNQLTAWFCEYAEIDLPGGSFNFWGRHTPDTPAADSGHVRLADWAAPDATGSSARLAFAWRLRGQDTHVVIELAPMAGGTQVKLHHSALAERLERKGSLHDFWIAAIENLRLCALSGRRQQFVEYGALPGTSMAAAVDIAAPAEEIFRCLIEPEWMAKLWNDMQITVEPVVGGVYSYGWSDGGPKQILALDPPQLLSFSWRYPPETEDSVVTWRLFDLGGGMTRLSLTHEGFLPGVDHEEYRAGWFSFLAIIKGICELDERWTRVSVRGGEHGEV